MKQPTTLIIFLFLFYAKSFSQSSCSGTAAINFQKWNNINGTAVSNLTSNANYPNNPSSTGTRTTFEMPTNGGSNFGVRMNGYKTIVIKTMYGFLFG